MGTKIILPDPSVLPDGYIFIVEGAEGASTPYMIHAGEWGRLFQIDMDPGTDPLKRLHESVGFWEHLWLETIKPGIEIADDVVHQPWFWWIVVAIIVCFVIFKLDGEGNRESD